MNFQYSTYNCNTIHRPSNSFSPHLNEDAHCDNEVNLILDKKYNHSLSEQSKGKLSYKKQPSLASNQTHQYYFMPIREQNSTAIVTGNHVTDSASLLLLSSASDHQYPSTVDDSLSNYFSSFTLEVNSSDMTTVNNSNNNLSDADFAALFLSSMTSTTPSVTSNALLSSTLDHETPNNTLDDVFLSQLTDLTCCSSPSIVDKRQQPIGPPPGFENFRHDSSSTTTTTTDLLLSQTTNNNSTLSSISNVGMQTPVASSDTINFSQLLQSTAVDTQQQQPVANNSGTVRSSSSSHSSFTSEEQSMFFPMLTHPYSSSSSSSSSSILNPTSQIFSTNTPLSSVTASSSTTTTTKSAAKPHIPTSLSLNNNNNNNNNNNHFLSASLLTNSTRDSPITITTIENDKKITDGEMTPNRIFSPTHSFLTNGHTDFIPTKPTINKVPSHNYLTSIKTRTSTSSASSTSSSIDEALIQLTQQQQLSSVNKLFNDEPLSIFHSSSVSLPTHSNLDKEQQAIHDNIHFLASMATASSPVTSGAPWQQPTLLSSFDTNGHAQHKMRPAMLQRQVSFSSRKNSANIQELMQSLNELCYKGFDELNALIQEQRWVQNYVNINSPSPNSLVTHLNGSNCCSSRVLIVSEYFIFKCKKIEITASHVFELLALARAELRLRDLMFVFKSWKESIANAEMIHQEEENKLRLSMEHPQSYYMTDSVLQAAFDHVSYAIHDLCDWTQKARAAFQYATLNIFQTLSRQQQIQSQTSSTPLNIAQFQSLQQQKALSTSSMLRPTGAVRTTP
ncbi:unnamed protein product [Adineta ricciae]|uniref:Uncharacterized protein n=1 Tax=Adineta ricciae TaxID=249248 RepID=A0A813UEN4_ADIRI|nr:unnamed protein product [Adineta ricciae]